MCIEQLRIGYFGDGPWAHRALNELLQDESITVAFVMVRYDKRDPILCDIAKENNIDCLFHSNINSDEFFDIYTGYDIDLNVSMSFNQIFKERMINSPRLGTINCHAGKLPYYRGRNILNWALINDEKEFGVTVHYVDDGIDTGDIILQNTYPITDEDDYGTLLQKAYFGCAECLYSAIKQIQSDNVTRISQKNIAPVGMYCGIRREGDEVLNWNQTSRCVFNFVRALTTPGPCARTFLGEQEIKIKKVQYFPEAPIYIGIPGQVIGKEPDGYIVKTSDSFVKVFYSEEDLHIKIGDRFTSLRNGE